MQPHAIITPLKAIRMLLDGTGVLVRAERWKEITEAMQSHEERADEMLRVMGGSLNESMQRNVLRRLITAEDEVAELKRDFSSAIREVEESTRRWETLTSTRQADKEEIARLRGLVQAFVEHHDNGQAGQPGHPKTYGEQDVWLAEWDRRYAALKEASRPTPGATDRAEG